MKDHDFTAVQMYWKPALLKLTQIANPDMDDGQTTACYIDPQAITIINRSMTAFAKAADPYDFHQRSACTSVTVSSSLAIYVTETPEQIAILRDRALGHEQKLTKV